MKRILSINNFFKTNENVRKTREVNLQQLWNDFRKYRNQILNSANNENITVNQSYDEFIKYILNPIFENKEIEFHRSKNIFDDEIIYGFFGRVKDIKIVTVGGLANILVDLYDNKDTLIMAKLKIWNDNIVKLENSLSTIIKVYDNDITTFEKMFNILNDVNKYNL